MGPEIWPYGEPVPFQLTDRGRAATESPDQDPVWAGPTRSAENAARWLARDGRSIDDARAQVRAYQDAASERLGMPVHDWGLDDADLAAITADTADPAVRVPRPRSAPDDEQRRAALAGWHAADATVAGDDGLDRGPM
jgi:hypothetical protein